VINGFIGKGKIETFLFFSSSLPASLRFMAIDHILLVSRVA